jgi:hypothetical protein
MSLITFESLPSRNTPINADNLNNNFKEILNLVYPVGRGFIDFTDTDYSNYLGFTWERELVGLTPVGYNPDDADFNEIGKQGGNKEVLLTEKNLPRINFDVSYANEGGSNKYGSIAGSAFYLAGSGSNHGKLGVIWDGEQTAINNMQPYQAVAYWKRVA